MATMSCLIPVTAIYLGWIITPGAIAYVNHLGQGGGGKGGGQGGRIPWLIYFYVHQPSYGQRVKNLQVCANSLSPHLHTAYAPLPPV